MREGVWSVLKWEGRCIKKTVGRKEVFEEEKRKKERR